MKRLLSKILLVIVTLNCLSGLNLCWAEGDVGQDTEIVVEIPDEPDEQPTEEPTEEPTE